MTEEVINAEAIVGAGFLFCFVVFLMLLIAGLMLFRKYRNQQKRVQSGAWDKARVEARMSGLIIRELHLH